MNVILRYLLDLLLRFVRSLDLMLLAALVALMGIGLVMQYSASNESTRMVTTQGVYFCVGLGALWAASRVPAHVLKQLAPAAYFLSLLPLVLVLFIGKGRYGNHWINLGFFNFQPSELAKLTLPMLLAWILDRQRLPLRLRGLPLAVLIIALPVGLILLQRDFGTAVLVLASGVFVLFLAGLSWRWFIAAAGAVAALAPVAWFWLLRPYQKDRILTFLNPESDPMGAGWNIIQSKIAIGGGGLTGKGWGEGTQS
ncbi:MAG: FtsW/RodA/SpoVE family cell cycle protein, partial [Thermomonas sp.]